MAIRPKEESRTGEWQFAPSILRPLTPEDRIQDDQKNHNHKSTNIKKRRGLEHLIIDRNTFFIILTFMLDIAIYGNNQHR